MNLFRLKRGGKHAAQLAALINHHLANLNDSLKDIVSDAQSVTQTRPDPLIFGKVEQISKWCLNPFYEDYGLGKIPKFLIKIIFQMNKKLFLFIKIYYLYF